MNLHRHCATIYLPARHGRAPRIGIPVWAALAVCLSVPVAAATAVLLALGAGPTWLRSGSPLGRENAALRASMVELDRQVELLAGEMTDLKLAHDRMAGALALPPFPSDAEAPEERDLPPVGELRALLQQARAQRAGYEALLDTFALRKERRARLPSINPCTTGWQSSSFGYRPDPFTGRRAFHRGIDISLPLGSPVRATADGRVVSVERQRGLGLLVKIDHGQGLQTVYGHLGRSLVKRGVAVRRGQTIALSGDSGRSSAPHLHYEVRRDGQAVNPRSYLLEVPVASR